MRTNNKIQARLWTTSDTSLNATIQVAKAIKNSEKFVQEIRGNEKNEVHIVFKNGDKSKKSQVQKSENTQKAKIKTKWQKSERKKV